MTIIQAQTPQPYTITLGHGITLSSVFTNHLLAVGNQVVIISDTQVAALYASSLQAALSAIIPTSCFILPCGEHHKSRHSKAAIEDHLQTHQYDKQTILVALGGGVITDITGFTAATYLRGIPVFYLPTTMLAMVDAAIGGKTGINTPQGKNQIGLIHSPTAVYIDPRFLPTQTTTQWHDGWVETLKHALLTNDNLFIQWSQQSQRPIDIEAISTIILESCRIKNRIVEQDPLEHGIRKSLNIGHTVGHALETSYDYRISHGQAVAIGIIVESTIANILGILPDHALHRIQQVFTPFTGVLPGPLVETRFLSSIQRDKKNRNQHVHMCLLRNIGEVYQQDGMTIPIETRHLQIAAQMINHTFTSTS